MNDLLIDLYKNNIALNITKYTEGCFYGIKIQLDQKIDDVHGKRMYRLVYLNDIELINKDEQKDTIIIDLIKDMVKEMVESENDEE